MHAKSRNAAVLINDLFSRLQWHGWHATPTEAPAAVLLQYRSPKFNMWREVECSGLALLRFIKGNPSRYEVGKQCDRKPAHQGAGVQQELNFSEQNALVRDALNPNQTQH